MPLITEAEVIAKASAATTLRKSTASAMLTEAVAANATFDVFLSHSSAEPENILLGVKRFLEEEGLSVYVDKYTDPQLSPDKVTRETAELLRGRMKASKALLYIHSQHSKSSRWMPWELGFFDGTNGRVGVIPVAQTKQEGFKGEEYLSLYPYVDRNTIQGSTKSVLWINQTIKSYAPLAAWLRGKKAITAHT